MNPALLNGALAPELWPTFALLTARVGGLMLTAPLWSMAALPRAVRAAVAVLLAVVLLPTAPRAVLPEEPIGLAIPVAMELLVGLLIGLVAAVIVQGVALAGEVISIQMGLSLGNVLAPSPDLPVSGVGQLQGFLALLIYAGIGGHLMLLRGLAESLSVLPPGGPMALSRATEPVTHLAGTLFTSALRAAAPVMVTLLLTHVAIAILSRAVPQINALLLSFPITIAVGLLMLWASMPFVASAIQTWTGGIPGALETTLGSLRSTPGGP